jgi:type II secretory pathway pseudopilin PulG
VHFKKLAIGDVLIRPKTVFSSLFAPVRNCRPDISKRTGNPLPDGGLTLLELLATLALVTALTTLAIPCWGMIARSRARTASVSIVMGTLERARQTALSTKNDVWVLLRHPGGGLPDSLRLLTKKGSLITPLDSWQSLPDGITFHEKESLMEEHPNENLLSVALNGGKPSSDTLYGSVMFQSSGRIGIPAPGGPPLTLSLDSKTGSHPEEIVLSRATGRATYQ